MSKTQFVCQAKLKTGLPCPNRAQEKYDRLWCGIHARSKGYVTLQESKRRVDFTAQPLACQVTYTDQGLVQLGVLTLESLQIHQHQYETAAQAVNLLQNGDHHVLIAAEPQLGKTGTIQTICWMATRLNRNINPIVILPMNDNDLAQQIAHDYHGLIPQANIVNAQNLRDHLYLQKLLASANELYQRQQNSLSISTSIAPSGQAFIGGLWGQTQVGPACPQSDSNQRFLLERGSLPPLKHWIIIDESHLGTTFINGSNTLHRELSTIGVNLNLSIMPPNVRLISVSATPMAEVASLKELTERDHQLQPNHQLQPTDFRQPSSGNEPLMIIAPSSTDLILESHQTQPCRGLIAHATQTLLMNDRITSIRPIGPKTQITMSRPSNYYGIKEMNNAGQLVQTGPLRESKWAEHFLESLPRQKHGYIIVRVSQRSAGLFASAIGSHYHRTNDLVIEDPSIEDSSIEDSSIEDSSIEGAQLKWTIFDCHHKRAKTVDFNELTSAPPTGHHFLFIYGRLRASKRLQNKEHILAVHDYSHSCDATVQGLLGRLCGYQPHQIQAFVNLQVVQPYLHWSQKDFNPQVVPDKSKNISGGLTYQMLRRVARGFFPVEPVVIPLTGEPLSRLEALYQEFQASKTNTYLRIADRVLNELVKASDGLIQRSTNTSEGASRSDGILRVRGIDYTVRKGNAMMFLTTSNSQKTLDLFSNRYRNHQLGIPVLPFATSGLTSENHYFLYINLISNEIFQPCLWLGLVEYQDDHVPTCDHLKVKPESLYALGDVTPITQWRHPITPSLIKVS